MLGPRRASQIIARGGRSGSEALFGDKVSLDRELAARTDDPQRAPGHAELAVRNDRGRLDLELAIDLPDVRVDINRDRTVTSRQPPVHLERVTVRLYRLRLKTHARVVLGVEEIA